MNKKIIVPYGTAQRIAASCGCHRNSVRWALSGAVDSQLAQVIRKRAIEEYGGKYVRVSAK